MQRKKCREEAFKRPSSLISSKAYQRRILWSLTCSCNVDTKTASDQHVYWALIFFRIYFTTSIKSKLTSKNFICCTCNVTALLQNSKNSAICSCYNFSEWFHHIATKWKLFRNVAKMFYVGWITTLHTNTACKISELKEQRHNLHK